MKISAQEIQGFAFKVSQRDQGQQITKNGKKWSAHYNGTVSPGQVYDAVHLNS